MAGDDQTQPIQSPGSSSSPSDEQTTRPQEVYPGMTLGGRYVIEKELGRGGIAIVYLARDQQLLSRRVVIKLLLEELGHSDSHGWLKKKFRQEMEALARIDHPGVVGAIDAGEMPSGKPYLVMQYIEGVNLRAIMKLEGMDFAHVADLVRQIGQALNAAHDKGVFHRDLKPENIMVQNLSGRDEYIKLIDFGIATIKDSQVAASGSTTAVAGTVSYIAPEQLMGKPSAASDIYALGVIAYEMLTGRRPFNPASSFQLYELQRAGVKVRPIDLRPGLPEAAQEVILKALSFDAKDRHSRARDFAEELARAMSADAQLGQPDAQTQRQFAFGEAPNVGPFVFKTCDRSRQVNEFTNFFINNLKQHSGCPQVYLVRGEERECHDSLVERLIHTQIKRFAEKKWGLQRSVITVKKLGWTYEGELEELQHELERMLFAAFDPAYMEDDLSAIALSNLGSLSLSPLVVIQHRIHAARWDRQMRALIEWYFTFWAELANNTSSPQFVIFLNVIYPKAQAAGWWKAWLGPKLPDKNRIERELHEVGAFRNAGLPCLILRELLPVKQDEVRDWFSLNNMYSEKTRYELLEKIFMTDSGQIAEHKSMADIEHDLQGLVESIQKSFIRTRGYL